MSLMIWTHIIILYFVIYKGLHFKNFKSKIIKISLKKKLKNSKDLIKNKISIRKYSEYENKILKIKIKNRENEKNTKNKMLKIKY